MGAGMFDDLFVHMELLFENVLVYMYLIVNVISYVCLFYTIFWAIRKRRSTGIYTVILWGCFSIAFNLVFFLFFDIFPLLRLWWADISRDLYDFILIYFKEC